VKKRTLAICCAAHTLHDGLSDVSYVLLPLLANSRRARLRLGLLGDPRRG
jgi:hypothetical protein